MEICLFAGENVSVMTERPQSLTTLIHSTSILDLATANGRSRSPSSGLSAQISLSVVTFVIPYQCFKALIAVSLPKPIIF